MKKKSNIKLAYFNHQVNALRGRLRNILEKQKGDPAIIQEIKIAFRSARGENRNFKYLNECLDKIETKDNLG